MATGSAVTAQPPLPPGFTLDAPPAGVPPLPPGFTLDGGEVQPASFLDKLAGGRGTSLLYGAVSPAIAAAQALGGEGTRQAITDFEASRARGKKVLGREGFDFYQLGGSVLPASKIAGAIQGALPAATSALGRAGVATAQGAAIGAASPTPGVTLDDYVPTKAIQTATSGALSGLSSGMVDATKGALKALAPIKDLFSGERGVANLARRGYQKIIGEEHVPAVREALLHAKELVPGDRPTAAEAVAHLPEGSPLQALQKVTAKTEGGPSAAFGERALKQVAARDIAGTVRNQLTAPMREKALDLANAGKVQVQDVRDGLSGIVHDPALGASDVVKKAVTHLDEKLASLADANGVIDAKALYTVRKELGSTISKFSQETQNWDKRLTGRIEGDIQKGIDWAINNAIRRSSGTQPALPLNQSESGMPAPTLWDQYLREYSQRSRAIADSLMRQKLAGKPVQQTSLSGGRDLTSSSMPHVSLLSRPVVMANALLSHIGTHNVEPKVDALNTRLMLNPNQLGQFLQDAPAQPNSRYGAILRALMAQSGVTIPSASAQLFTERAP